MLKNIDDTLTLITTLARSLFTFFLTGSRFFGGATEHSDWDFYTEDSWVVRDYLANLGFEVMNPDFSDYGQDPNTAVVYHNGKWGVKGTVQIQLVKDLDLKTKAQDTLNSLNPGMRAAFMRDSKLKRAQDWWKWAHTPTVSSFPGSYKPITSNKSKLSLSNPISAVSKDDAIESIKSYLKLDYFGAQDLVDFTETELRKHDMSKIMVVKAIRTKYAFGLKEAKDVMEATAVRIGL